MAKKYILGLSTQFCFIPKSSQVIGSSHAIYNCYHLYLRLYLQNA